MTDEERDQIREATDIVQLIGEDVELRQRGGRFWGRCPFHDERTPSFAVDPTRGTFYCFGCQAHGDVFDYVMKTRGLAFPEAVEHLAARAGITLSRTRHKGISRERIAEVLDAAASFAREVLEYQHREDSAVARAWLEVHGIGRETSERWGIGLAPGNGEISRALRGQGFTANELRAAGIQHPHGDSIHHVVCVPMRDASGRTIGLAGQSITNPTRVVVTPNASGLRACNVGADPIGDMVPFTRDALLGIEQERAAIRKEGRVFVTLGPLEALALHESGIANCVASLGGGVSERQAKALAACGASSIELLYPHDGAAGTRAAIASSPASLGVDARVLWEPTDIHRLLAVGEAGVLTPLNARGDESELIARIIDLAAGNRDTEDPDQLIGAVHEACRLLAPAAERDRMRAYLLAMQIAERFGVRNSEDLMGPILSDAPIGDESWKTPVASHSTERHTLRIGNKGMANRRVCETAQEVALGCGRVSGIAQTSFTNGPRVLVR